MNSKQKELIGIFIFLFIFSFIVINWNDVSWLFNYREISGLVYDFFNPYQESDALVAGNQKSIPLANATQATTQNYPYTQKPNSLEIPSLGVDTPIVISQSTDKFLVAQDLDKGAVYYPGSVLPGQAGQIVILGHSAPPNWPHIKHDYIFSDIGNLKQGDQIMFYFNNREYTYTVRERKIIMPGQDISPNAIPSNSNILTLISCWPPGKNYQRIAVSAELMSK